MNVFLGRYTEIADLSPDVIYADPPYANTTSVGAKGKFDSTEFWGWVRKQTALVFVSEYIAPEDFVCVFQAATNGLRTSKTAKKPERLFVRRADLERYPYLKELVIEKQG